uniref:DEAD/DEAH box helicase n=1 Tax=Alloprevotella sp. TaxID=1872471 RepID=UPI003FEE4AB0
MRKEIQLYKYQKDMLRQIEDAFVTHQSVMVQMPTGTGKTVLISEVVKREERRVKNPCVWIVVHRRELVEQIKETLERRLGTSLDAEREKSNVIEVFSIQWLSRHYQELEERPSLIVIDEAHHAVAKTYEEVMNAYPNAKKLGVTATPCRLTKRGFTDLFEVLLCSHSIPKFIKEGYLSDFDYISLNPNSEDQKKIDGLEKRAADGDYNIAEMQEVLDCKPSIERLYQTIKDFASGKKGIVYAINIEHAEHIAEYYREQGLAAVAISSKTPKEERRRMIELFKEGSAGDKPYCASLSLITTVGQDETPKEIQILVNVDLFGEGFDCPDVEFIQLARPTLSLAKYLQMVGRGLRVAKGKECCTLLDNVGLYRLFGLPTTDWDWSGMFLGRQAGKGDIVRERDMSIRILGTFSSKYKSDDITNDRHTEMVVIARHDEPDVSQRLRELLYVFRTTPHMEKMRSGYMGGGRYIRTEEPQGLYNSTNKVRMGWQLVSEGENETARYWLLHTNNERMVYVGRKYPWDRQTDGVTEMYCYANEYAYNGLKEIYANEPEYITGGKRKVQEQGLIRKDRWGEEHVVTYMYYGVGRNKGEVFNGKDAYVCELLSQGEYAICNNNHHIILHGLKQVQLSDDNVAKVVFLGEDETIWVNLYTMQEFDKRPTVERVGFMEMLRVGFNYYFYKNRQLAGIPIQDWSCVANDHVFLFMERYVILKGQTDTVFRVEGEYRKGNQWMMKLRNMGVGGAKGDKEIPSAWMPRGRNT